MHALIPAYPSNEDWNGIATTPEGRIFVYFHRPLKDDGPRIAEVLFRQHIAPYPSAEWNTVSSDRELLYSFLSVQSIRFDNRGSLWVLDRGCHTEGCLVKDSAKLVEINLEENEIRSIIPLNDLLYENSRIKDMRIIGDYIFLSDVGEPDLIVINTALGNGFRINDKREKKEVDIEFKNLSDDSDIVQIEANYLGQIELSRDGKYLFYQSMDGNLKRFVADNFFRYPEEAERHFNNDSYILPLVKGALAVDREDNLLLLDAENARILKYDLLGNERVLIEDDLLLDADRLWVDHDNFIWITLGGKSHHNEFPIENAIVRFPVYLFKIS